MTLLTPPRVTPPAKPLGRIAFLRTFVRNPLEVLPRAVYEEDFRDGRGFVRAALRAREAGKPVVLITVGTSGAGARAGTARGRAGS